MWQTLAAAFAALVLVLDPEAGDDPAASFPFSVVQAVVHTGQAHWLKASYKDIVAGGLIESAGAAGRAG